MDRTHLSEKDKDYLGRYCCNCGSEDDVQYHHIVPLSYGGNNVISNMCCLCGSCHDKIHYKKDRGNLSESVKAGLNRARQRGVVLGHLPGTTFITKKSLHSKGIIANYAKEFGGDMEDPEVMERCGCSRNSYYKYKRELRVEASSGIDVKAKYLEIDKCDKQPSYTSHYRSHNIFVEMI
jgi:hypothetical protein